MSDCENCILKNAVHVCEVSCLDLEDALREHDKQIRAEVIEEIFNKADKMMNEQINNLNQSPTRNGKMWARYMNTYLGHIKVACGRLKESKE